MNDDGSTTSSNGSFWGDYFDLLKANVSANTSNQKAAYAASTDQLHQTLGSAGIDDSFTTNALTNQAGAGPPDAADIGGMLDLSPPAGLDTATAGPTTGTGASSDVSSGASLGTNTDDSSGTGSQDGSTTGTSNGVQQQTSFTIPGFWDVFFQGLASNLGSIGPTFETGNGPALGMIFDPSGWANR